MSRLGIEGNKNNVKKVFDERQLKMIRGNGRKIVITAFSPNMIMLFRFCFLLTLETYKKKKYTQFHFLLLQLFEARAGRLLLESRTVFRPSQSSFAMLALL